MSKLEDMPIWFDDDAARRARAAVITDGPRGRDGLTDGERELLWRLEMAGLELVETFLVNERTGKRYWHRRTIRRRAS